MFSSKIIYLALGLSINSIIEAQELFPLNEPASSMPKGVFGVRASTQAHYKTDWHREIIRLMYGLTPRISLMLSAFSSNYHITGFPEDLNSYFRTYHNHKAAQTFYPYYFEGIHLYSKWRFLSFDHKNEHLRFAIFNELSYIKALHLDAYPTLMGDNSGISFGLITTKLYKKAAVSITTVLTNFIAYNRKQNSEEIKFKPGNSLDINLSFGYLLWPRTYKSYKDLNVNIYFEVLDKYYSNATITRNDIYINTDQFGYLRGGNLIYFCPGIQFILKSKTRIDFVTQEPICYNASTTQYSMFKINMQHYLF